MNTSTTAQLGAAQCQSSPDIRDALDQLYKFCANYIEIRLDSRPMRDARAALDASPSPSSADIESSRKQLAEAWRRQIINAGGDENVAQQAVALAALNGLFGSVGAARSSAGMASAPSRETILKAIIEAQDCGLGDTGPDGKWRRIACNDESLMGDRHYYHEDCDCSRAADAVLALNGAAQTKPDQFMEDYKRDTLAGVRREGMVTAFNEVADYLQEQKLYAYAQPKQERSELTKLAAECHRAKWKFDLSEDFQPSKSAARALITNAFNTLHRIGDMALKLSDASSVPSTDRGPDSPVGWGGHLPGKIEP